MSRVNVGSVGKRRQRGSFERIPHLVQEHVPCVWPPIGAPWVVDSSARSPGSSRRSSLTLVIAVEGVQYSCNAWPAWNDSVVEGSMEREGRSTPEIEDSEWTSRGVSDPGSRASGTDEERSGTSCASVIVRAAVRTTPTGYREVADEINFPRARKITNQRQSWEAGQNSLFNGEAAVPVARLPIPQTARAQLADAKKLSRDDSMP